MANYLNQVIINFEKLKFDPKILFLERFHNIFLKKKILILRLNFKLQKIKDYSRSNCGYSSYNIVVVYNQLTFGNLTLLQIH